MTSATPIATEWKEIVWRAAASRWSGPPIRHECAVALAFRLPETVLQLTALSNLLKATLDGLGRAVFAHSPSGQPGPWSTEDWWICELTASKRSAANSGVDVAVGSATKADTSEPDFDVWVDGSPAVWIGSGERAWKETVCRSTGPLERRPLPARLGVALEFRIEPERINRVDVDNLCIPAVQGLHAALFGPYVPAQANKIEALRAVKRAATNECPAGLGVRLFDAAKQS